MIQKTAERPEDVVMKRGCWAILGVVLFLACNDSVVGLEEATIESWRSTQNAQTIAWTFQNNGSLRVVTETDEVGASFFQTRYTIAGNGISIHAFSGSDDQGNPVDFPASNCDVQITDRTLRMTCDSGTVTFTRVGPGSETNAV